MKTEPIRDVVTYRCTVAPQDTLRVRAQGDGSVLFTVKQGKHSWDMALLPKEITTVIGHLKAPYPPLEWIRGPVSIRVTAGGIDLGPCYHSMPFRKRAELAAQLQELLPFRSLSERQNLGCRDMRPGIVALDSAINCKHTNNDLLTCDLSSRTLAVRGGPITVSIVLTRDELSIFRGILETGGALEVANRVRIRTIPDIRDTFVGVYAIDDIDGETSIVEVRCDREKAATLAAYIEGSE